MSVLPTREQVPQIVRAQGPVRRPVAPAGGENLISGRDLLRIIRKRKWVVVLCTGISSILAFTATFLWWTYAPQYTATALLEVQIPATTKLSPGGIYTGGDALEREAMSQTQLIRSESVLQKALEEFSKKNFAWYRKNQADALKKLQEDMGLGLVPKTNLLRISLTSSAANDRMRVELADMVNIVADKAVEYSKGIIELNYQGEINKMTKERDEIVRQIDDMRRAIEGIRTDEMREKQINLEVDTRLFGQNQRELEMAYAAAQASLKILADQEASGELLKSGQVTGFVDQDPMLRALMADEERYAMEVENASRKYGPASQQIPALQTRLDNLRNVIAQKKKDLTEQAVAALKGARQSEFDTISSRLADVTNKYMAAVQSAKDIQKKIEATDRSEAEIRVKQEKINALDIRITDQRLLTQEKKLVMARPAATPNEPSQPQWSVMMPMGVMAGLVIGLALAFGLEFIDTSIKGPADISRRIDLPILGMVPHIDDLEEDVADARKAFSSNPNSLLGEAFRQIRTCLQFSGPAEHRRTLLVSSPLPHDGRSVVAMNLAATIARSGKKTLVVDANFRQPLVSKLFTACPNGGLSSALVGEDDWKNLIHQLEDNLSVMASGPMPPNPAELLGSDQMRQIISQMTEQYEQVIFDGPPATVVTDAIVLGTMVDGVVLVIRAHADTYGVAQRARDVLLRVGARIVGVVLNGVRVTAGGYLRKNYETFYEYHNGDKTRILPPKAKPRKV